MKIASRPTGVRGLKRLTNLVHRGSLVSASAWGTSRGAVDQPMNAYVTAVLQSLAVFRFVSFAMGAGLVFILNPEQETSVWLVLVVVVAGFYNIYRVIWRFDPSKPANMLQWTSVAFDVLLSVELILMSGGLNSAFLIYSLSPILTTSLLMDVKAAVTVAGLTALTVSGAYVASGMGFGGFPWILSGNYLVFSLLYSAVCLLIAYLPFIANLNWQRRVRNESLTTERSRLQREVHDSVAQTLAFLSLKMRHAEERASEPRAALTVRDVAEIGSVVERAYLAVRDYLDGSEYEESTSTLKTRLPDIVDQWRRDTGLAVAISMEGVEGDLPPKMKHQILQIGKEALANVAKHARASNVRVHLSCTPENIVLTVRDNGRGFAAGAPRGHGMDIMKERAAMVGASLTINSVPGEGTEVAVVCSRGAA